MTRKYTPQDIEQLCCVPGASQHFTVERWADAQASLKEAQELDAAGRHAEAAAAEKAAASVLPEAALAYALRCEEGRGVEPSLHDARVWNNKAVDRANLIANFARQRPRLSTSRVIDGMECVCIKALANLKRLAPRPVVHLAVSGAQNG